MKATRPKLVPTLVCLTCVGLFAATIPYPGFQTSLEPLNSSSEIGK